MLRFLLIIFLFAALLSCDNKDTSADTPASSTSTAPAAAAEKTKGIGTAFTYQPDDHFGPIGPLTYAGDLPFLFGSTNVRRGDVDLGNGLPTPAIIVAEGKPEEFIFINPEVNEYAEEIQVTIRQQDTPYRLANSDLRPGMTLAEVEAINGVPFDVLSFDLDDAGYVTEWNGGTLTGLSLQFRNPAIDRDALPENMKEDDLKSDLHALRELGLLLDAITVYIPVSTMSPTANYAIVPGYRLGPLTPEMTAEDFEGIYQAANYETADIDMGSGLELAGYHLFSGTPNEVFLTFANLEEGEEYNTFTVVNPGGDWFLTGTDIRVGSTLADVVAANGKPFTIIDGSREGSGEVAAWNGGRLAGTYLTLGGETEDDYFNVQSTGEVPEISSEDERLNDKGLRVTSITVVSNL